MKNYAMMAMLFIATTVSAQFYVSGTAGYAMAAGKKVLGEKITATGREELKGSYGEGFNMQLRGGYFFTERLGVELGLGYLHGSNQEVQSVEVPGQPNVNIEARGRAYGASLSLVYNVTENFYARGGLLTKIAGETRAKGAVKAALPAQLLNPKAPATQMVPLNVNFTTDFHGKPPLGFIGALGYKFPVAENIALFAELEYMGINVTRDVSNLKDFTATVAGKSISRAQLLGSLAKLPASSQAKFAKLLPLLEDEAKWGEGSLPSAKAPYSSFGINVGVIYTFTK